MHKIIRAVLILIATTSLLLVHGQEYKLEVGPALGVGISLMHGDGYNKDYNDQALSHSAGFFIQYNINKTIGLRSGLHYEKMGTSFDHQIININGETLGYVKARSFTKSIMVPIMAQITFGYKTRFFINIGPYINYLMRANTRIQALDDTPKENVVRTDAFRGFTYGGIAGIGLSYPINDQVDLFAHGRISQGFSSLLDDNLPELKGGNVTLLFGCSFRLGEDFDTSSRLY